MKPLRHDPETDRATAEKLEAARQVEAWSPAAQEALWRRISAAADARQPTPRRAWLLVPALVLATVLAVILVRRPAPKDPTPAVAEMAHVTPAPDAKVEPWRDGVALTAGHVDALPGAHLRTPHLEIRVVSAHCRVQVAGELTLIDVLDGEARVRRDDGPELALSSGMRLRSDDPRLAPVPQAAPAPASVPIADPCAARGALSERQACYRTTAMGSDLAAQNALYLLGKLDRTERGDLASAIAYWRAYQQRFPEGALWPEASLGILTAELERARYEAALAEAERYLARAPDGARAPEVRLIRANLWREHFGKLRPALEAYRALREPGTPASVQAEATFGAALAADRLGEHADAQAAIRDYLRLFPDGPHAAEARRMLSP